MPVPIGLDSPHAFAAIIRPSITVPDLTTVTGISFDLLYPDRTTKVTGLTGTIPATIPGGVAGLESVIGQTNPTPSLLVAVHVFAPSDLPGIGTYLVRPMLVVAGVSKPVRAYARQLIAIDEFGQ